MPRTLQKLPILQSGGFRHTCVTLDQSVLRKHEALGLEEETRVPERIGRHPPYNIRHFENLLNHITANYTQHGDEVAR